MKYVFIVGVALLTACAQHNPSSPRGDAIVIPQALPQPSATPQDGTTLRPVPDSARPKMNAL